MENNLYKIADILKQKNNFYILTHKSPDGDTLGSAFALYYCLKKLGKKSKVLCSDVIPSKFNILRKNVINENFEPDCIVAVDIADTTLLGQELEKYSDKIDICIDHHSINQDFAKLSYINSNASANCENIFELINLLKVKIDQDIANCLYTGISTDTGCFKYSSVTSNTHLIAAKLIDSGAENAKINKLMFDTKTKSQIKLEKLTLDTLEFFHDFKCALIYVDKEIMQKSGAKDYETDFLSALPRKIEGVLVGITVKEKASGVYKISVRTDDKISSAKICSNLGGGGHQCAGGCTVSGVSLNEAIDKIKKIVEKELAGLDL